MRRFVAFYGMLKEECAGKNACKLMYGQYTLRHDISLLKLETRGQLVNFLATAIWHIRAGHEFTAENISYFADPYYACVRLRESWNVCVGHPYRFLHHRAWSTAIGRLVSVLFVLQIDQEGAACRRTPCLGAVKPNHYLRRLQV